MKETPTTNGTRIFPFEGDQPDDAHIRVFIHNPSVGVSINRMCSSAEIRQLIEAMERALTILCDANP